MAYLKKLAERDAPEGTLCGYCEKGTRRIVVLQLKELAPWEFCPRCAYQFEIAYGVKRETEDEDDG